MIRLWLLILTIDNLSCHLILGNNQVFSNGWKGIFVFVAHVEINLTTAAITKKFWSTWNTLLWAELYKRQSTMRFLPQFLDTQSAQILKSNYSKEQLLGSQVSNCFIFPMTYFNLLFSYLDNSIVLINLWTWKICRWHIIFSHSLETDLKERLGLGWLIFQGQISK